METLINKLDNLGKEDVNVFLGPNNIDKAHIWLYRKCEELFGDQTKLEDKGKSSLTFNSSSFDTFALVSFNSYRGVIRSVNDLDKNANRYNIFKKGYLWSSQCFSYGKNFYYFLNKLSEIFEKNPVNTFSEFNYKSNCKKRHIIVSNKKSNDLNTVYIPDLSYYLSFEDEIIKKCAKIFNKYLSKEELEKSSDSFINSCKNDIKWIAENASLILSKLEEDKEIAASLDSFKKLWKYTRYTLPMDLKEFVKAAFVYAYNHLPYDLHLFYPKIESDDEIRNLSLLMIANKSEQSFKSSEIDDLKNFADVIEKVSETENIIVEKIKDSTSLQLKWQLEYQKRISAYDSFRHSVENICKAVCTQHSIKAEVTSRLKTFPSFFNKIYLRSNNNEYIEDNGENHEYQSIISSPKETDKYFDLVFSHIRDVAGVRIVCVYNSDVTDLLKIFEDISKNGKDIRITNIKVYPFNRIPKGSEGWDSSNNYRGIHVTLHPGTERLKLAEYFNHEEMQCEIQIRTILAHGWSDVQHPMEYKSTVPLEEIDDTLYKDVEKSLDDLSRQLREKDTDIVDLKERVDKISIPMDKYV